MTLLALKAHEQNKSNLLFAKNLRARLQIFFLLHFYEGENLFHLIQRSLATLTDDIRDVESGLQPLLHGRKRSAGVDGPMVETLREEFG